MASLEKVLVSAESKSRERKLAIDKELGSEEREDESGRSDL